MAFLQVGRLIQETASSQAASAGDSYVCVTRKAFEESTNLGIRHIDLSSRSGEASPLFIMSGPGGRRG